jgi:beta-glucanase (GH16 family)
MPILRPVLPLVLATSLIPVACVSAQQAWVPLWADEFNGTQLDPANWEVMTGNGAEYGVPGWGNNELQYYTGRTQNLLVWQGTLRITARAESFNGFAYTSARIRSLNRRDFLYGRMEARMKVPAGQGLWPAFWMLPSTNTYGGWASSGEIDILETVNAADAAHGTIHHGNPWPNNVATGGSTPGDWDAAYHVYAMEWEPDEIRWYIDGTQFFQVSSATWFSSAAPANDRAPFDRPFHFLLNLAVGGNWPGSPNASTPLPATFWIDYVRVSQRPPQAHYAATAPVIPARIEAENYDVGGATFAYFDTEGANIGGQYRLQEGVDIEVCSEGGHNVGWFRPNEWIEYSVDAPRAGRYEMRIRVATQTAGCAFRVSANGADLAPSTFVQTTASWQTYRTQRVLVDLPAGRTVLRITNSSASAGRDFNLNWIEIVRAGDANGDGFTNIEDLYALEAGTARFPDIDADGTPATAADRRALLSLLRPSDP